MEDHKKEGGKQWKRTFKRRIMPSLALAYPKYYHQTLHSTRKKGPLQYSGHLKVKRRLTKWNLQLSPDRKAEKRAT